MSLSTALVLAVAAPAAGGGLQDTLIQFAPILFLVVVGYFLMWRPQQQRQKAQLAMINGVKRGDTVVLSSGIIGKVVRVEDKELGVEIAQNVSIKVVRSMIIEVRVKGEPVAANDAKA
jgi:preprotein translocase subunit YajC